MSQLFCNEPTSRPFLKIHSCVYTLLAIGAALVLTACGGSSSGGDAAASSPASPSSYTVGGGISGLSTAGLVLQNNGGDNLTIAANATAFQFATPVAGGGSYNVIVATQPAGLTCTVSRGTGTNLIAAISNVSIVCSANTHTIAGTITGLTTNGLVLRNNGADDLAIAANATSFQFATPIAAGGGYSVAAFAQPAGLTCTVSNGAGSDVNGDIRNVHIACSAITFTIGGTITALTGSGLVLQNNGGDNLTVAANAPTFEFATPVAYNGGYAVTVLTQPAGQFCSLTNAASTATTPITDIALMCSQTTLTPSVAALALSISGTARQITITNNGSIAAHNISITYPIWPTGTSASSICGSTLAAAQSCTITITPGATATSNCFTGIAPTPGTITIMADDAPTSSVDVTVLSYGCIYQAGYIYAIDDTAPATGSIGGKVISLVDQATPYTLSGPVGGVVWSSNGAGSDTTRVSYDTIPGVDETSTVSSGSPTYATFQTFFASTYTNANPFSSASFSACDGKFDGSCNTSNILRFYNQLITNYLFSGSPPFTASPGSTASPYYAAGSCSQTIGGYSDWYLPAICEMSSASNGFSCGGGTPNVFDNVSSLIGDANSANPSTSCNFGSNCVAGIYWSSTQSAAAPQTSAWSSLILAGDSTFQSDSAKNIPLGVRCARALTQ